MRSISLKIYLIILIILIAVVCLIAVSTYVLYQANTRAQEQTLSSLDSVEKQLKVQLIRISTHFELPENFPNLGLWQEAEQRSGLCVRFTRPNERLVRSVCRGGIVKEQWPHWFEKIYRWAFKPGEARVRTIEHAGEVHGNVTVLPSAQVELDRAWQDVRKLIGLSTVTVISLCVLLYFAIGRALRPASIIVSGLDKMVEDDFNTRLPDFSISEWQRTGEAVNHLAANLQSTLVERQDLALRLVNAQEEERRHLARELHDEFGQSIAGLNAIASLITQTASTDCPDLLPQGKQVSRIAENMMLFLREMLQRLRPVDFDEVGLVQSLKSLVANWNVQSGGKTQFHFACEGEFSDLVGPVPVNLFRIAQECLTNIAKHAEATEAHVYLRRVSVLPGFEEKEKLLLKVSDNGVASLTSIKANKKGNGLTGIRERVTALGGKVDLREKEQGGLEVEINIPLRHVVKVNEA